MVLVLGPAGRRTPVQEGSPVQQVYEVHIAAHPAEAEILTDLSLEEARSLAALREGVVVARLVPAFD